MAANKLDWNNTYDINNHYTIFIVPTVKCARSVKNYVDTVNLNQNKRGIYIVVILLKIF